MSINEVFLAVASPAFVLVISSSKSNILNFFFQLGVCLQNKNYERLATIVISLFFHYSSVVCV